MNRAAVVLLVTLVTGCAAKKPAESPPPAAGGLYNDPPAEGTQAQRLEDAEKKSDEANTRLAKVVATAIRVGAAIWLANDERCPTVKDLVAIKFVNDKVPPEDPWGSPFIITCPGKEPVVTSPGPDTKLGTADDIVSATK